MIIDVLLIALIMASIHQSGFIENMDNMVGRKFPLHHLPYPIRCLTCGTWWISFLYLLITSQISLFSILTALVVANMSDVFLALLTGFKNMLYDIIENLVESD